jgi:hypothetical protein
MKIRNFKLIGILMSLLFFCIYFVDATIQHPQKNILITQNFELVKPIYLEISEGQEDSEDTAISQIKLITNVKLEVHNNNGIYKECSWTIGKANMTSVNQEKLDSIADLVLHFNEGIVIKFLINQDGQFQHLTNFKELKDQIIARTKVLKKTINPSDSNEKWVDNLLTTTMETPDMLLNNYYPGLKLYFGIFGENFQLDSIYFSKTTLLLPFGMGEIPAKTTKKVDSLSDQVAQISAITEVTDDSNTYPNYKRIRTVKYKYDRILKKMEHVFCIDATEKKERGVQKETISISEK